MRMLLKAQVSTETANAVLKDGSLGDTLNSILADTKPEAVYFLIEDGLRTVLVVFDMQDVADMPAIVEPWFLALGANVKITPVLNGDDFANAGPSLGAFVPKYG